MKILHLTLKSKWYDRIESGEKREEYREIKPYWERRLNKEFDSVIFKNGYHKAARKMVFRIRYISKGFGLPSQGAPTDRPVFIITLGDRVQ